MESYDNTDDEAPPAGALTTAPQRAGQVARQDFAGSSLAVTSGVTEALVAKARASVEACVISAKKWPRNLLDSRQRILEDCRRPGFAATAMYSVPRGTARAEGLSIRFAEAALRAMGNMDATSETIYDDATVRMVRVRVIDFETNAAWSKDFTVAKTVERKFLKKGQRPLSDRINSSGERVFIVEATDDDVATKEAALVSKASRTGILRLIPADIQEEAKALIRRTTATQDAKDPLGARNRMLDSFSMLGVKPSAIESWLGHALETITLDEMGELKDLHTAIGERETSWNDALQARLADREASLAAPSKPAPAPVPIVATASKPAEPAPATRAPSSTPQPAAAPAPAARASTGRGTGALRGALAKSGAPAAKPEPAPDIKPAATVQRPEDDDSDPEAEPTWMAKPEVPPGTPPPREGWEDRNCKCGVVIEVEIGTPPGALCYVCRQA